MAKKLNNNLKNVLDTVDRAVVQNVIQYRRRDGKKALPVKNIKWYKDLQRFSKRYGGPNNQKIATEILASELTYYAADKLNKTSSGSQAYLRYWTGVGRKINKKNNTYTIHYQIETFLLYLEYNNLQYEEIEQYYSFLGSDTHKVIKGKRPS